MSLKQAEWLSKTWNGWSGQMPSDDDVINRSPVWYSGLPFILPNPHPPGVCCWSHPFTGAIAKTLLVETLAQTFESLPHPPIQTRLWYSYSEEFCLWLLSVLSLPSNTLTQHTFILPHTLWSTHTPWKIPGPFTSSARYTSRLPLTCFYKVKHSQEEGKNTWSS